MAKYNSKSVYGTLFTMLDNLSQENQDYLMENVFDGDFLEDIKSNPKKAYDVLNKVVINIEDGKTDKVSKLLSEYKDKIYMMKNMLKNYGNFEEKKFMAKYDWKIEKRDEDWSDDTYAYFLIHINLKRMAEYLTKEFKKDWWFKADFGQDNCYIVAENNNFPVRLFFTFEEGGWADITRHYTDGATLKDDHLGSWHFGKYDIDYSYAVIRDNIENYFYKFEESMKEEKKSLKESSKILAKNKKGKVVGYIEPQKDGSFGYAFGSPSQKEVIMFYVDTLEQAKDRIAEHSYDDVIFESKKSARKSLKEYRTVGFEQLVRDTIVEILENSHSDLFNLGMADGIITYDNKGRARITSNGDVDIDYITLPTYFWSSGYTPSNKKTAKLCEDMMDSQMDYARERLWDENKDELIELGITDKDDEKLNYHDLYDMGAGDLAEELSEYEMDLEGMDLYTDVYCELEETDEGIELTVSMTVQDEYGHTLVKDYKSNTVLLQEDADDLEEFITDAIREVTEQF